MARRSASGLAVFEGHPLFLLGRGGGQDRRPSPQACPLRQAGVVPAVPDRASALQPRVRQAAEAYSCCAGAQRRQADVYYGCLFPLDRVEDQQRREWTSW